MELFVGIVVGVVVGLVVHIIGGFYDRREEAYSKAVEACADLAAQITVFELVIRGGIRGLEDPHREEDLFYDYLRLVKNFDSALRIVVAYNPSSALSPFVGGESWLKYDDPDAEGTTPSVEVGERVKKMEKLLHAEYYELARGRYIGKLFR